MHYALCDGPLLHKKVFQRLLSINVVLGMTILGPLRHICRLLCQSIKLLLISLQLFVSYRHSDKLFATNTTCSRSGSRHVKSILKYFWIT